MDEFNLPETTKSREVIVWFFNALDLHIQAHKKEILEHENHVCLDMTFGFLLEGLRNLRTYLEK